MPGRVVEKLENSYIGDGDRTRGRVGVQGQLERQRTCKATKNCDFV